ncbi:hypothetical protein RHMOL_Rhmol08G0128900 [Rhododendron molle]|uniref:Uncharacterized protein n=1 Tax=Rhododendron molle TaxID=49168 RepID=A0ACC0MMT8_RHOML|nr:hypothetical protein RHMOL_Rhmol08G0128900 [Rhododendron molle]
MKTQIMGVKVILLATLVVHRQMISNNVYPTAEDITFAYFSDGYDDGIKLSDDRKVLIPLQVRIQEPQFQSHGRTRHRKW